MKFGSKSCKETDCTKCPFSTKHISVCTAFKLDQTLYKGLTINKYKFDNGEYNRIKNKLDMEETK